MGTLAGAVAVYSIRITIQEEGMESRARKQAIVRGGLLVFFGALALVEVYTDLTLWTWTGLLAAAGLGGLLVFLTDRSDWGLLLPTYVLWAIAAMLALIELDILRDEVIALYALVAVALPFLALFLRDRSQWWALIPAYVLIAMGIMVILIEQGALEDELPAAYVMLAVAAPFFVVYARNPKQWWPLIPGGILAVIGLFFLLAGDLLQYVPAVVLVLVGAWILVRQFTRREALQPDETELSAQEDDELSTR
jgi:multisubunit Na+/H+ antiporter MnhC subunit